MVYVEPIETRGHREDVMNFTKALAHKQRRENRYEARVYINEDTCGYEIFDHVFGRIVERSAGYDGNYAARRAADRAIDALQFPQDCAPFAGSNCQFSTDCHYG